MSKDRTFNLSLNITGRFTYPKDEVDYFITAANEAVAKKKSGYQLIVNVTGGAPVDETNFDEVFTAALRSGFRKAARNGELEDFKDLSGVQIAVKCEPRGSKLSEGQGNE